MSSLPRGKPVVSPGRFRLDLPRDRAVVRPLRDFVAALGRAAGMSPRSVRAVRLAVGEMFENSVEHGPGGDSRIAVVVEVRHRRLRFTLTETRPASDEAWERFREKIRSSGGPPGDPDQGRGWGIRIVHGQMDRCDARRLRSGRVRVRFETHG